MNLSETVLNVLFRRNEIISISALKALYQMFCISAELDRYGPNSLLSWWTYLDWSNQKCAFICVVDQTTLLKEPWVFIALLSTPFSYGNNIYPTWRCVCSTKTPEGKILTVLPFQTEIVISVCNSNSDMLHLIVTMAVWQFFWAVYLLMCDLTGSCTEVMISAGQESLPNPNTFIFMNI